MVSEWPSMSLRDASVELIDCDHRTPPASPIGYPYVAIPQLRGGRIVLSQARRIGPEDYTEWTRKAEPKPYDVVLSRRCNPGETAVVEPGMEFALGQNLVLLRADGTRVYPPFLRWLVRGPEWWEQVDKFINVGAVFDSLKCTDVPSFHLRIPPLPEQHAIARMLASLDDKIELNRRMNETLEATARAIFKSWFVDFDPVRAKAEGRWPPGMDAESAALFPDSFEDSPLGTIPKGWQIKTVVDIASVNSWTLKNSDELDTINYIEISAVDRGDIREIGHYKRGLEPSRARRRLRHGDTVLSTVRPERHAYFLCLDPPASLIASTGFAVVTPEGVPWSFVHAALTHADVFTHLGSLADGGAYPAVRPDMIGSLELVAPAAKGALTAFHRLASPMYEAAVANRKSSRTLESVRDALLPKLLGGELRTSDVASQEEHSSEENDQTGPHRRVSVRESRTANDN